MMQALKAWALGGVTLMCTSAFSQGAPVTDTLYLQSKVGSFKLLGTVREEKDKVVDVPVVGRVEISFSGTVLISDLTGTVVPSGDVRLEIDRPDQKKKVFFGKGKLVVDGSFRAMQFFGRDLSGKFTGTGIARLYGEFDRNLNTGSYWYASQPEKKPWGNGGITVVVPAYREPGATKKPLLKKAGGK